MISILGLKCYKCPFDEDEIEKPCALDPTQADVTECSRFANACLTETGESKSQSGDKKVQYTQCGGMKPLEDLDEDNCEGGLMSKQFFIPRKIMLSPYAEECIVFYHIFRTKFWYWSNTSMVFLNLLPSILNV